MVLVRDYDRERAFRGELVLGNKHWWKKWYKIDIWRDRWVGPKLLINNVTDSSLSKISDLIDDNIKEWKIPLLLEIVDSHTLKEIIAKHLPRHVTEDRNVWTLSKEGEYSVKQGYEVAHKI